MASNVKEPVISSDVDQTARRQAAGAAREVESPELRASVQGTDRRSPRRMRISAFGLWVNSLRRQVARIFKNHKAAGYAVSLLIHVTLLFLFSAIVLNEINKNKGFSTTVTQDEGDSNPFEEVIDTRMELAGFAESASQPPQFQAIPFDSSFADEIMSEEALANLGSIADAADGLSGDSVDRGAGYRIPDRDTVVSQGSFTVWTEPESPLPKQKYIIYIHIKLPERVRRYPLRDLSGWVRGTDKFYKPIPDPADFRRTQKFLQVMKHETQLRVQIPGAANLVEDTIRISSRILNETQELKLVFKKPTAD